jgi:hypothetical protein
MAKKIKIKEKNPKQHLFHNEWINVYPQDVDFEDIVYWPQNLRTLLDFDLLKQEKGKSIEKLSLKEITDFLVKRPDLKLGKLAKSIEDNGVRVPLIILENGRLLDGNRRFFACSHIFHKTKPEEPKPDVLTKIPAFIIKTKDINERIEQKILAEANFVDDFRVRWPLEVRAKVISEFYHKCKRRKMSLRKTHEEIINVYGIEKKDIEAYVETVALTKEYISTSTAKNKNKFRQQAQKKFVYFWEFRNKATKGRGALDPQGDLPKAKKLFFKMIENEKFDNLKQVEPMIRAKTDPYAWNLLIKSNGSRIAQVEAMYKEQKAIKSSEDKIRNFLRWLKTKAKPLTFSRATVVLLNKVISECKKLTKLSKV